MATVEQGQGWTVLQYSGQPSHDTVGALGARRACSQQAGAGRIGRWACWRWALGVLALGVLVLGVGRAGAGRAGRQRGALGVDGWAGRVHAGSGTARALQITGARGAGAERAAGGAQELGARGARGRRAAWALGVRAGNGCALGALRLVFNPVFRLGIFPESLNEHCSW